MLCITPDSQSTLVKFYYQKIINHQQQHLQFSSLKPQDDQIIGLQAKQAHGQTAPARPDKPRVYAINYF